MNMQTPTSPLEPEGAFVVQFRVGTNLARGPVTGRVEHVVSGQATWFGSLAELTAFFDRILTPVPPAPTAPTVSEDGAR